MFEFIWSYPVSRCLITRGNPPVLVGLVWPPLQRPGMGRVPGDVVVEGEGFRFCFPTVTSILVRLALPGVHWLLNQ